MTEINLKVGSPHLLRDHLQKAANYLAFGTDARHTLDDAIAQIEEQVKPAIEEPQEFASVVRAGFDSHSDRTLWVRVSKGGWQSDDGAFTAIWQSLHKPEVLRVGIDLGDARRDGYEQGTKNTRERLYNILTDLKPTLITSPEKNAIDKALALIEADVENTVTGSGFPS